ncbi:hypothetical protein K8T27_000786 [Campylobacter upsaliensis]|uniref:hypothetical protein n=2 Tax=Campylobacter upsaliensis TaxID=28080 RepID=UPI000E1AA960|nr:hypothetical protein [Campylobacter upsaliensis]EAI1981070.1 hypothetical protein [Campylobacter upsaliensis]EAI2900885.1 hypothetical protein [Campylobacter upsaliensis]EAI3917339.1 hypothetical protein [Campylobacter upsaliensis]EAI4344953.1 hypothetical protein [Campylobacter upsaliensis]EAI4357016.1 hypothetical protein [Campylobacter upsaliensis]
MSKEKLEELQGEINKYKELGQVVQEQINELNETYNYLLDNDQSGKSRLIRIQEVTSDNIINDIKQKINDIDNSYAEIFSNKGNIPADLLNKYEQIKNIHDDLIVVKNSENLNKVEDLNRKIDDFLANILK